jgi:hypothetical protein
MMTALHVTKLIQHSHNVLSAVNEGFDVSVCMPVRERETNFRNSLYCLSSFVLESVYVGRKIINCLLFSDIDTDELDSDTKNVEEEVVEFFIKEEITVTE